MTQFIIIAYDGTDEHALDRRMKARTAHTDGMTRLRAEGKAVCGVAITDESGKMIGSTVVTNFKDRAELDAWLRTEPYVTGKVWEKITIHTGNIGPSFADLIKI